MAGTITNTLLAGFRQWSKRRPKIFISYRRRGEGAGYGGRIADKLVEHFGVGQCFRDVDDIESGVDFVQTIQEAVGTCEVLIAVIGPDWINQTDDKARRRLDDPRDFVRLEVAAALERDIRVIPVLVGGAAIPTEQELPHVLSALSRRQAHELTDSRWEYDVTKLVGAIESIGIRNRSRSRLGSLLGPKWRVATGVSAVGGLVMTSVLINMGSAFLNSRQPLPTSQPAQAVDAKAVKTVEVVRTSQEIPQHVDLERALERERRERQEAERTADLERQRRREREAELEQARDDAQARKAEAQARKTRERATAIIESELRKAQAESQVSQRDVFNGIRGKVQFTWEHERVVYHAVVVTNGPTGMALVNYIHPVTGILVTAEQDLEFVRKADGAFYVGSNPRLPGTTVPHPAYAPDIFRLAQLRDGNWSIGAVGPNWQHFDSVVMSR